MRGVSMKTKFYKVVLIREQQYEDIVEAINEEEAINIAKGCCFDDPTLWEAESGSVGEAWEVNND